MFESPYRYESGIRTDGNTTPVMYEVCQSCGCDLWSEYEVVATLCVDCIDLANTFVDEFLSTRVPNPTRTPDGYVVPEAYAHLVQEWGDLPPLWRIVAGVGPEAHTHEWATCSEGGDFDTFGWPCSQCVTCGEFGPLMFDL